MYNEHVVYYQGANQKESASGRDRIFSVVYLNFYLYELLNHAY